MINYEKWCYWFVAMNLSFCVLTWWGIDIKEDLEKELAESKRYASDLETLVAETDDIRADFKRVLKECRG